VDGQGLILVILLVYFVWMLYMMTFRTEDYRKLQEDNWNRGTKVLGTGWKIGSILFRLFGPKLRR
jgi:hypothetical protein